MGVHARLLALVAFAAASAAFVLVLPHGRQSSSAPPALGARELAAIRASAARVGIEPDDVRVLVSMRDAPRRLLLFAAGGESCIGAQIPDASISWRCPSSQLALVAVDARPAVRTVPGFTYPLYVLGVVRDDVSRVVFRAPGFDPWVVYRRTDETVGSFGPAVGSTYGVGTWPDSSKRPRETRAGLVPRQPWQARLTFFGERGGKLATLRLRFARPGARLVVVR